MRYKEAYTKPFPIIKAGVLIKEHLLPRSRVPLATSLGPTCMYYAPFMSDALDQETVMQGARYRYCRASQPVDMVLIRKLRNFTKRYVLSRFDKINPADVTFEGYLQQSHYTEKQKQVLRLAKNDLIGIPEKLVYKGFGKIEFMNLGELEFSDIYKLVRCINGPPNKWKAYAAPCISAVEHIVCQDKHFAKYIPVRDRPGMIFERLHSFVPPYVVTDYTSFESGFTEHVEWATEQVLYEHMLQDFEEMPVIIEQMKSVHHIKYRDFKVKIPATRMSGDPQTSLGNGFTNLMIMLFVAEECGLQCDGFVEGDDGLFAFSGVPDMTIPTRLGFELKFVFHPTLFTTSFCGLLMSRSLACYSDPVYQLVKFGWSTSRLRDSSKKGMKKSLLRGKALSLLYCHPRCPILTALALKYIQLTNDVDAIFQMDYWSAKISLEAQKFTKETIAEIEKGISPEDREDFYELFHVSVDVQLCLEEYIQSRCNLLELDHWTIDILMQDRPYLHWMNVNYASYGVSY